MSNEIPSTLNGSPKTGIGKVFRGKLVTEIISNGHFMVDRDWTVTYWNGAAEKILGIRARDIMGKNIWSVFAAVLPTEFYASFHKAFLQDIPIHFKEYWGEMEAWFDVITYFSEGTLSVSFKSSKQQVQQAQQLKALNELYQYVTEVTNDCLWEWDLQARELFWIDGGHKRVFGYPIENALIPQSFWEHRLHPNDKKRVLGKLNRVLAEGTVSIWEDEYKFRKSDGDYLYVHDRAHIICDGGKAATRMIGATQDITSRKLTEMKLAEERLARQKEITQAVLTAQEKERADIGKELHDNLNQILGAAKLYIEMAKTDVDDRDLYLDKSSGYIMNVIEEIRRISKTLASPATRIMGLSESIRILLDDLIVIQPMKIEFHEEAIDETVIDAKLQLDIFRIIQEQFNNILKHAKATRATIDLSREADAITLLISDNGEGADMSKENAGVGIINIRSRAELYHGKITIVSKPGEGYSLKVVLPINV